MDQPQEHKNEEGGEQGASSQTLMSSVELTKNAWAYYKEHFSILLLTFLIPSILIVLLGLFAEDALGVRRDAFVLLPSSIFIMVVQIVAAVALLHVVLKGEEHTTIQGAYRRGLEGFFSYIWISFLTGLFTIIGLLLFIVPGIIVAVWLSFALYVFVAEDKRGLDALIQSREYVRGYWWAVLRRFLFLMVIALCALIVFGGVMFVLALVTGGLDAVIDFGGGFFSLLFTPFSLVYTGLLYKELKEKKEQGVQTT